MSLAWRSTSPAAAPAARRNIQIVHHRISTARFVFSITKISSPFAIRPRIPCAWSAPSQLPMDTSRGPTSVRTIESDVRDYLVACLEIVANTGA